MSESSRKGEDHRASKARVKLSGYGPVEKNEENGL